MRPRQEVLSEEIKRERQQQQVIDLIKQKRKQFIAMIKGEFFPCAVISNDITDVEKEDVVQFNKVLFIRTNDKFFIGYSPKAGAYAQQDISDNVALCTLVKDLPEGPLVDTTLLNKIKDLLKPLDIPFAYDFFNPRLYPYMHSYQYVSEPFPDDYSTEPRQVMQMKDILNVLYHAEVVVELLNGSWASILLNGTTIFASAQKAAQLIVRMDVDLLQVFGEELSFFLKIRQELLKFVNLYHEDVTGAAATAAASLSSYELGVLSGMAVNLLNAEEGSSDYAFLSSLGANFPTFINALMVAIQDYSEKMLTTIQPYLKEGTLVQLKRATLDAVNPALLEEIQAASDDLLQSINTIQRSSSAFVPLHLLRYVAVLKQVAGIATVIVTEVSQMNGAAQTVVRSAIRQLKYDVIPYLLSELDKIEDQFLLRPGFLTDPMKNKIKELYNLLIATAKMGVDFSNEDQDLEELEDLAFVRARAVYTSRHMAYSETALMKANLAHSAYAQFFSLLKNILKAHGDITLAAVDAENKVQLINAYKALQPFMEQLSPDWHNRIVENLTGAAVPIAKTQTWGQWFWGTKPTGTEGSGLSIRPLGLKKFLEAELSGSLVKKRLLALIEREQETSRYHLQLTNDIIDHAYDDLPLVALSAEMDPVKNESDEASTFIKPLFDSEYTSFSAVFSALGESAFDWMVPTFFKKWTSSCDDAFIVAKVFGTTDSEKVADSYRSSPQDFHAKIMEELQGYENTWFEERCKFPLIDIKEKERQVVKAKDAFNQFIIGLKSLQQGVVDESLSLEFFKKAYASFQPWVIGLCREGGFEEQSILQVLNEAHNASIPQLLSFFPDVLVDQINQGLTNLEAEYAKKKKRLEKLFEAFIGEKVEQSSLSPSAFDASASNYVIKHSEYSNLTKSLREDLFRLIPLFSREMQAALIYDTDPTNVPFPDISTQAGKLIECQQVLGIKSLANLLYHLEKVLLTLEKLDPDSSQKNFLKPLWSIRNDIFQLVELSMSLTEGTHFKTIFKGFIDKLFILKDAFAQETAVYFETPDEKEFVPSSQPLWLSVQALKLMPANLQALENGHPLRQGDKQALHGKTIEAVADIDRIIANAGSYSKLFLEIPTCYQLLENLRADVVKFAATSHSFLLNNLETFYVQVLTPFIIEADNIEFSLGLDSGLLSSVVDRIVDEFFKGLIAPLTISSNQRIALVTSNKPLESRVAATEERLNKAIQEQQRLAQIIAQLKNFQTAMESCNNSNLALKEAGLVEDYAQIHPLLVNIQDLTSVSRQEDPIDTVLHRSNLMPQLTDIRQRVITAIAYYTGLHKTAEFSGKLATEQKTYLEQLLKAKPQLDKHRKSEQVKKTYAVYVKDIIDRPKDLIHVAAEYNEALNSYFKANESQVVKSVKNSAKVDVSLEWEITGKEDTFIDNYWQNYKQLDNCIKALNDFNNYLGFTKEKANRGADFFETKITWRDKQDLIDCLQGIAVNKAIPIKQRLASLRNMVTKNEDTLLAHKKHEKGLNWLLSCVVSLFEALGLYTAKDTQLYTALLKTNPAPGKLVDNRFSFWGQSSSQNASLRGEEEPLIPLDMSNSHP